MSGHFGIKLDKGKVGRVKKKFDMVSSDGKYVGDAKYLAMVHGIGFPSAKMMEITGHVWLLEKVRKAKCRFLVFGNQRKVPERWLKDYGNLPRRVDFYFLETNGNLELLH